MMNQVWPSCYMRHLVFAIRKVSGPDVGGDRVQRYGDETRNTPPYICHIRVTVASPTYVNFTDCHYLLHPERSNASRFLLGVHTPSFSIKRTYLAGEQSVSTLLTSRIHCCTPLCCRWGRIQLIEPNHC